MDCKVYHPIAVVKFIVIPGNELDKVITEGSTSPSIKGVGVGILIKVAGQTWSSVQPRMLLRGPSHDCFTTFLMSSNMAAFSRHQVRSF